MACVVLAKMSLWLNAKCKEHALKIHVNCLEYGAETVDEDFTVHLAKTWATVFFDGVAFNCSRAK